MLSSRPLALRRTPVAPWWYLTSPEPRTLFGSISSKPAKISTGERPTTQAITLSRPRWLIASSACSAPCSEIPSRSSLSSGRSAVSPSSEKRL